MLFLASNLEFPGSISEHIRKSRYVYHPPGKVRKITSWNTVGLRKLSYTALLENYFGGLKRAIIIIVIIITNYFNLLLSL